MKAVMIAITLILATITQGVCADQAKESPPHPSTIYVACDNAPSDAAKINAAIAASPPGAEIVICGQALINQTIRLRGHRSYRGLSRTGTVLKQADGANLKALMASATFVDNKPWTGLPVSIRHLTLDGDKAKNPESATTGIALRSWLSVVEDVVVRNMGGDGIRITSLSADGARLKTTQVNGRISGNFITGSGRHGIFVEDPQNAVTDWTLIDNWIASSGADGIHLDNAAGWMIARNHIYGVSQNAIYAHRAYATTISDNYIEGFGATEQVGSWRGIYATIQGGATASTIANNRIFNFALRKNPTRGSASTYEYLALRTNYGTGVASITGNAIRGAGAKRERALRYVAPPGKRLIVTSVGNVIEGIQDKRSSDGDVTISSGQ